MTGPTPPRLRRVQATALTLLVVSSMINYVDRATLAVANPLIRQDLGLSIADMGYLLSAFLWAYAFAQLPTGALVDRLGPRRLLTASLLVWSLAQCLGGMIRGLGQFIGMRVLLGIGEAPQYPVGARTIRDWFNVRERGLAAGIFSCGSTLGTAISAPLLTTLMLSFGWRWMFIVMGVAGLITAAVWYLVYREPAEMRLAADEEAARTAGEQPGPRGAVTFREWKMLFRFRTTWGLVLGYFGAIFLLWIYTAWLPGYLEMERHLSVKNTGWVATIPFVCGVFGSLGGGWFSDWLVRAGMTPIDGRKYPAAVALLGTGICTLCAAYAGSAALAIMFISLAMLLLYVTMTCAWALTTIAVPANCTASIGSMQNFGGYLGGALAPMLTGLIVQSTHSFVLALVLGAAIGACSAVAYLLGVGKPISEHDLALVTLSPPLEGRA